MKVWLSRSAPSGTDNVVWIESDGLLFTLTADGKLITYEEPVHNTYVLRLLDDYKDDWEEL